MQSNPRLAGPSVPRPAIRRAITFNPALGPIANQTTGITVHSLNVTVGSPIAFSYDPANTDEIQIGGLDQGTDGLTEGLNDFLVDIFDASGATPFFGNLAFTILATTVATGQFSLFEPASRADGTVTVEPASAVPEPPELELFLEGCLLFLAIYARRTSRILDPGHRQRRTGCRFQESRPTSAAFSVPAGTVFSFDGFLEAPGGRAPRRLRSRPRC